MFIIKKFKVLYFFFFGAGSSSCIASKSSAKNV